MTKNKLQDTTGSEKNNHKENELVLVNNKESQCIINDINSTYEALMRNQNISKKSLKNTIQNIQDNFENSQFNLYGQIVDIQFIKKNRKEIQENKNIWQEILNGNFENHNKLTFIIPSIGLALSKFKNNDLGLNKLQSIDKDSAQALSYFQGGDLWLNGLQSIDKDIARALSQFQGNSLYLKKLRAIDINTSVALSKFQGSSLFLGDLQFIDKDSTQALSHFQGKIYSSSEIEKQIDFYKEEKN
jgi:hypothetical protein